MKQFDRLACEPCPKLRYVWYGIYTLQIIYYVHISPKPLACTQNLIRRVLTSCPLMIRAGGVVHTDIMSLDPS